jgi:hypothetical protein
MILGQTFFELCATQVDNDKILLSQGNNTINKFTRKHPGATHADQVS